MSVGAGFGAGVGDVAGAAASSGPAGSSVVVTGSGVSTRTGMGDSPMAMEMMLLFWSLVRWRGERGEKGERWEARWGTVVVIGKRRDQLIKDAAGGLAGWSLKLRKDEPS